MGLNSLQQALLTLKGPLALGGAFRYLWNHIAVREGHLAIKGPLVAKGKHFVATGLP